MLVEAAQRPLDLGRTIVCCAPNFLRVRSQSGNVAVKELPVHNLAGILASDYFPRSMLDAVFMMAAVASFRQDLPGAVCMATKNPAIAAGLENRGEIGVGERADLCKLALMMIILSLSRYGATDNVSLKGFG
ncbi:MAG: hypothetical protein ABJN26_26965 [Stappiaceae bacterium]